MKTYAIDRNKWNRLSLMEQLGNVSSEIGRTFAAKRRGDNDASETALARVFDLFDATAADTRRSYPELKEILRAKEEFLKSLNDEASQQGLENYFAQYAIAARISR